MRPFFKMEDKDNQENINKTPSKMARLAWPKAKYGAIIAIIIITHAEIVFISLELIFIQSTNFLARTA